MHAIIALEAGARRVERKRTKAVEEAERRVAAEEARHLRKRAEEAARLSDKAAKIADIEQTIFELREELRVLFREIEARTGVADAARTPDAWDEETLAKVGAIV